MQNFIAPSVMIFLFDKVTFVKWISAILTFQRYYLPVFFYLTILCYLFFITIKAYAQWQKHLPQHQRTVKGQLGRDLLMPLILDFHQWLLLFFTVFMMIFVFKNMLSYLYRAQISSIMVYSFFFKISFIVSAVYYFVLLEVIVPLIQKGHSFVKARNYFWMLVVKRWKRAVPVYLAYILWIYVSVLLFRLFISQVNNLTDFIGIRTIDKPLSINFMSVDNIPQEISNILVLPIGFLISNLLYYPIVYLMKIGFDHFKINMKSS